MPIEDPVAANAALWAHYLDRRWNPLLDPFGSRYVSRAIAAGVASWLALLQAPAITWMYGINAPDVTRFVAQSGLWNDAPGIPPEYTRSEEPRPASGVASAFDVSQAPVSAR